MESSKVPSRLQKFFSFNMSMYEIEKKRGSTPQDGMENVSRCTGKISVRFEPNERDSKNVSIQTPHDPDLIDRFFLPLNHRSVFNDAAKNSVKCVYTYTSSLGQTPAVAIRSATNER